MESRYERIYSHVEYLYQKINEQTKFVVYQDQLTVLSLFITLGY